MSAGGIVNQLGGDQGQTGVQLVGELRVHCLDAVQQPVEAGAGIRQAALGSRTVLVEHGNTGSIDLVEQLEHAGAQLRLLQVGLGLLVSGLQTGELFLTGG